MSTSGFGRQPTSLVQLWETLEKTLPFENALLLWLSRYHQLGTAQLCRIARRSIGQVNGLRTRASAGMDGALAESRSKELERLQHSVVVDISANGFPLHAAEEHACSFFYVALGISRMKFGISIAQGRVHSRLQAAIRTQIQESDGKYRRPLAVWVACLQGLSGRTFEYVLKRLRYHRGVRAVVNGIRCHETISSIVFADMVTIVARLQRNPGVRVYDETLNARHWTPDQDRSLVLRFDTPISLTPHPAGLVGQRLQREHQPFHDVAVAQQFVISTRSTHRALARAPFVP